MRWLAFPKRKVVIEYSVGLSPSRRTVAFHALRERTEHRQMRLLIVSERERSPCSDARSWMKPAVLALLRQCRRADARRTCSA